MEVTFSLLSFIFSFVSLVCLSLPLSPHFSDLKDTSQTQLQTGCTRGGSGFGVMGCGGLWFQQDNEYLCSRVAAFGLQGRHTHRHTAQREILAGWGGRYERLGGQTDRQTDRDGYGLLESHKAEHRPPTV